MAAKRYIYSVLRARRNLLEAIRAEIRSTLRHSTEVHHTTTIARREAAIRDLIASVRHEERSQ
jgi:hypothetical protein